MLPRDPGEARQHGGPDGRARIVRGESLEARHDGGRGRPAPPEPRAGEGDDLVLVVVEGRGEGPGELDLAPR